MYIAEPLWCSAGVIRIVDGMGVGKDSVVVCSRVCVMLLC